MADSIQKVSNSALDPSLTQSTLPDVQSPDIGKNEFLELLVAQLKNQDPLDPQNGDEFAVNLAQFTQVEQLIEINDKLGGDDAASQGVSSLASYLGHEVILDSNQVSVENNDGGILKFNLSSDVSSMKVELLDEAGGVKETIELGASSAGSQSIVLNGLDTKSGKFDYKITANSVNGSPFDVEAQVGGIVSGFIPGPDQTLLIGGKEVSISEILEVHKVQS